MKAPHQTSQKLRRLAWGTFVLQGTLPVFCARRPAPKTCAWGAPDEYVRGYTRLGQCPSMWLNEFIKLRVLFVMMELCTCRLLLIACWRR